MRSRAQVPLALVVCGVLALSMVACSGADAQPGDDRGAADVRALLRAEAEEVAAVLVAGGLQVSEASGRYQSCSGDPSPSVGYGTEIVVSAVESDVAETVQQVSDLFEGEGWTLESSSGAPRPSAELSRDHLTLSAAPSRRVPGSVAVGVGTGCVPGDLSDVEGDLAPEPIPVPTRRPGG